MIFVSRKKYKRCKRQLEDVQVRLASTKIELIDAHNDVRYLRDRIVRAFQLGIIDRLKAENNELRAEIERLKTENLTQGFECVGVSAI